jgi:septum site-determining protein MinD
MPNIQFFVGLANPAPHAIREMDAKGKKWEMNALARLLSLRTTLLETLGFDIVFLDTSPGLNYSAINAVISSDVVLIVTSIERSDLEGTKRILSDFYNLFEKKFRIILNKIPSGFSTAEALNATQDLHGVTNSSVIGTILCSCELLRAEGDYLAFLQDYDHPFNRSVEEIATKIENATLTNHSPTR